MKFYNREQELERLSEISSLSQSGSHMVVITGRRRVGKTELIRQFSKGKRNVLYLLNLMLLQKSFLTIILMLPKIFLFTPPCLVVSLNITFYWTDTSCLGNPMQR